MTQQNGKRALVRRSLLSIALKDNGRDGMAGTCKTEADWERQCSAVAAAGYELVDLDAHDASTGRRLPSDAWKWNNGVAK